MMAKGKWQSLMPTIIMMPIVRKDNVCDYELGDDDDITHLCGSQ